MRDAGHRTPDAGHRTSDGEKSKNNISTPQGGGHNLQGENLYTNCSGSISTIKHNPMYPLLMVHL